MTLSKCVSEEIENYIAPDEIETESYILYDPITLTGGRVKRYDIKGRTGIVYKDMADGRFISEKRVLEIAKGNY